MKAALFFFCSNSESRSDFLYILYSRRYMLESLDIYVYKKGTDAIRIDISGVGIYNA